VDRAIRHIEQAVKELDNIDPDYTDWAREGITDAIHVFRGLIDEFEGLRTSNSKLREWGEGLESELESAAQTISDLEDRVSDLEYENERLKETVQSWENSYT